jgi:hypothetical protein
MTTRRYLFALAVLTGCAQVRGPASPPQPAHAQVASKTVAAAHTATITRLSGDRAPGQVMLLDDGRALIESGESLLFWSGGGALKRVPFAPADASRLFPSAGSTFLVTQQIKEDEETLTLWDAKTLAPKLEIAKGASRPQFSEDGSAFLYTLCGEEQAEKLRVLLKNPGVQDYQACEYRVHDASTGELRSKLLIPYLEDEGGPAIPTLSPNGHFVFILRHQKLEAYDVATAKRTLKREGGAISQQSVVRGRSFAVDEDGMAGEVLHAFSDDTLLLSRFGMVELSDLKTGKVLGSSRYPSGASHVLSTDRTQVATLFPGLYKAAIWDITTRKIARVVTWHKVRCDTCNLESFDGENLRVREYDGESIVRFLVNAATGVVAPYSGLPPLQVTEDGFRIELSEREARVTASSGKKHLLPPAVAGSVLAGGLVMLPADGATIVRRDGTLLQLGAGAGTSERIVIARNGELGVRDRNSDAEVFLGSQPSSAGADPLSSPFRIASDTHTFVQEENGKVLVARDTIGNEVMRQDVRSSVREALVDGKHIVYADVGVMACTVGVPACQQFSSTKVALGLSWPYVLLAERNPALQNTVLLNLETGASTPVPVLEKHAPLALLVGKDGTLQVVFIGLSEHRLTVRDVAGRVLWTTPLQAKALPKSGNAWVGYIPTMARQGTKLLLENPYERSEYLLLDATRQGASTVVFGERGALEIRADGSARTYGDRSSLAGLAFCESPGDKPNETLLEPLDTCVPK